MDALQQIRRAVVEGRYALKEHAVIEALADNLHVVDIESAVLTGRIVRSGRGREGEPKHTLAGRGADLRTKIGLVAVVKPDGGVYIITVYEVKAK